MNSQATKAEFELMNKIADRAVAMARRAGFGYLKRNALMDINACHCNGCPLELAELLTAGDYDFAHDVFGIRRHLDRETGKLGGCFLPRHAKREVTTA